jgi:uncharacterized membrane protein (UPF0127 family)
MAKVKVTNLSRGTVVLDRAEVAGTIFSRMKGLLGRSRLSSGEGLLLKPANSIHTIGMKFAIDIAFVDRRGIVRRIIEAMPPGRLSPLVYGSAYVIEAAAGEFKKSGTVAGDRLHIESCH